METTQAIEIIKAMADGIDPTTGERMPSDSPYQQVDIVRALYTVLPVLESQNKQKAFSTRYPRHGEKWTIEEVELLKDAFNQGMAERELARKFQRSKGGIKAKLFQLGLIEDSYVPRNNTY